MSTYAEEFKKVKDFWRSLEENNQRPCEPCAYFRKRKLISSLNPHSTLKSTNQFKLHTYTTEDLNLVEEKNLKPVSNEEVNQESLHNQCTTPEVIITDVDLSSEDTSERIKYIQIQCIKKEAEVNLLDSIEENPVASENFDDDLSVECCVSPSAIRSELECGNQFLSPEIVINDSESVSSDLISNDGYDSCSISSEPYYSTLSSNKLSSGITNYQEDNSEVSFFDDDWYFQRNHIFVLSYAGKPIFSLQRHGSENKMSNLFGLIQCFISNFENREDRIMSIEAEGIKFVFFLKNTVYLVAASRDNISENHLRLQLREVYNRIGFLLTLESLNKILEDIPAYDIRQQLKGNSKLILNQLTSMKTVSNNIFTLFTDSIRVLPLHPDLRASITRIIRKRCSKISNLAFAILIVDDQLVALVRSGNQTIHSADIRLIFNLLQCSENVFTNFCVWILPICLPNFNKDCYLHAYISSISDKCEAFLILLAYDCTMTNELSQAHEAITKALHKHDWYKTIFQQINNGLQEGNGFNIDVINIPELWHFLYMPKSSNHQLLCSKIMPPYTCLSEFKRLETIYRDLHNRIHNKSRPLQQILEVKEKEVALALKTKEAEIYAVFDPLVNTILVANSYINKLERWINSEKKAHFIRRYPKI